MPALPLKAAVRPSALIKTGRWTMLLLGVAWGSHRWQANHEVEEAFRAKEAIEKPIRDAKHAAEKVVQDRLNLIDLANSCGVPVPKDF